MYHVLGALILLIGIIVMIKYIMRTSENKTGGAGDHAAATKSEAIVKDETGTVHSAGTAIKIKNRK